MGFQGRYGLVGRYALLVLDRHTIPITIMASQDLLQKTGRRLLQVVERLTPLTLAVLVLLASAETFAWTFFERSWPALGEIQALLLIVFGLLAAAVCVARRLHLGVELLTKRLPPPWPHRLDRMADLATALFGVLLTVFGALLMTRVRNTLPGTGLSAAWQYLPATLGGLTLALLALAPPAPEEDEDLADEEGDEP